MVMYRALVVVLVVFDGAGYLEYGDVVLGWRLDDFEPRLVVPPHLEAELMAMQQQAARDVTALADTGNNNSTTPSDVLAKNSDKLPAPVQDDCVKRDPDASAKSSTDDAPCQANTNDPASGAGDTNGDVKPVETSQHATDTSDSDSSDAASVSSKAEATSTGTAVSPKRQQKVIAGSKRKADADTTTSVRENKKMKLNNSQQRTSSQSNISEQSAEYVDNAGDANAIKSEETAAAAETTQTKPRQSFVEFVRLKHPVKSTKRFVEVIKENSKAGELSLWLQ